MSKGVILLGVTKFPSIEFVLFCISFLAYSLKRDVTVLVTIYNISKLCILEQFRLVIKYFRVKFWKSTECFKNLLGFSEQCFKRQVVYETIGWLSGLYSCCSQEKGEALTSGRPVSSFLPLHLLSEWPGRSHLTSLGFQGKALVESVGWDTGVKSPWHRVWSRQTPTWEKLLGADLFLLEQHCLSPSSRIRAEKAAMAGLGWEICPGLPWTFLDSALKAPCPGNPLSPAQTGTVGHALGETGLAWGPQDPCQRLERAPPHCSGKVTWQNKTSYYRGDPKCFAVEPEPSSWKADAKGNWECSAPFSESVARMHFP